MARDAGVLFGEKFAVARDAEFLFGEKFAVALDAEVLFWGEFDVARDAKFSSFPFLFTAKKSALTAKLDSANALLLEYQICKL